MSTPKADQLKTANVALIALFVLILWLPTVDSFLHFDTTLRLNENRAMTAKPVFTGPADTKDYLAGLELYFNDHFGYRKMFVRMQGTWKRKLFGEASVLHALIGRGGWLYTVANNTIDNYTGVSRFSPQNLAAWQTLLEARHAWLQKHGAAYVVVVTPDKQSIYPEHLPVWLKRAPGPTKLDQWLEHFRQHSALRPLDLRPLLRGAKKKQPVYMMTDTHWNGLGAYLGYQALVREISKQVPAVQPLPDDAFALQPIAGYKGDLAVLIGQESHFPESQANTCVAKPGLPALQTTETMIHDGKKHVAITRTHNPQGSGTAIVFHDSFGAAWFPFVGLHFRDAIFVAQRDFDLALIEKEKPVIVIDQIVERIVDSYDPDLLLDKEALAP